MNKLNSSFGDLINSNFYITYISLFLLFTVSSCSNNSQKSNKVSNDFFEESILSSEYLKPSMKVRGRKINGLPNGEWIWTTLGLKRIVRKSTYKNGWIIGDSYTYYENGNLKTHYKFDEDTLVFPKDYKPIQDTEQIYLLCKKFLYEKFSKPKGEWITYYRNGKIRSTVNYSNGVKSGQCKYFYEDGKLNEEMSYKDGLLSGDYKIYYPNGQLKVEKTFSNGTATFERSYCIDGKETVEYIEIDSLTDDTEHPNITLRKEYYDNGHVKCTEHHKMFYWVDTGLKMFVDLLEGERIFYYKNDSVALKEFYKEDKLEGVRCTYYENGQIQSVERYLNGEKHGDQDYYRENSKLVWESNVYNHGKYIPPRKSENRYATDGQKCTTCGLGRYQGGFCSMCGGASSQRVTQSYSKAASCEMCNGSGFLPRGGLHGGYKVCPSCRGRKKQIY